MIQSLLADGCSDGSFRWFRSPSFVYCVMAFVSHPNVRGLDDWKGVVFFRLGVGLSMRGFDPYGMGTGGTYKLVSPFWLTNRFLDWWMICTFRCPYGVRIVFWHQFCGTIRPSRFISSSNGQGWSDMFQQLHLIPYFLLIDWHDFVEGAINDRQIYIWLTERPTRSGYEGVPFGWDYSSREL